MPVPPAITGEGFNWGYFIGCAQSTGSEGRGPTFPVLSSPSGFQVFDVATPWAFSDYDYNMMQPSVIFPYIPPGTPSPYPAYFRLSKVPNIYRPGMTGRLVTFNDGSTVTIDANTFTSIGTYFTWVDPVIAPSTVTSYSGMHLVT